MKLTVFLLILCLFCPVIANATLSPEDLASFQLSLSSILSFFAGNLAVIGFIAGILGGRL